MARDDSGKPTRAFDDMANEDIEEPGGDVGYAEEGDRFDDERL